MNGEVKIPGIEKFREKKLLVDGLLINFAEAGEGEALIFIHGWTNNWISWVPVARRLAGKYRVILVDLPGYGDSGRLPHYDLKIQADYLRTFVERLKIGQVTLVALSMGTYVAAKFYSLYPQQIKRVILVGAVFRKDNKRRSLKAVRRLMILLRKNEKLGRAAKWLVDSKRYSYLMSKYVNMYRFNKLTVDRYGVIGKRKMSREAFFDMGAEVAKTDSDMLIKNNKVPFLLVYGANDKIIPPGRAMACLRGRGTYSFACIRRAGHIVPVERPGKVAKIISEFLKDNNATILE